MSVAPVSARRLVILSGSPKPTRSASAVLGARLAELMAPKGWESVTFRSAAVLASPERWVEFAAAYGAADLIVLSLPLYVDGLPAPLVRVLEKLAPWGTNVGAGPEPGAAPGPKPGARLAAMVQSGFPEARQNVTALGMCRVFARKAGLRWAGGLAIGSGGAISRRLEARGRLARYLVRALDLTAAFLGDGKDIPAEAVALAARPPVPGFALVYRVITNSQWRAAAKANGVADRFLDQPYRREN